MPLLLLLAPAGVVVDAGGADCRCSAVDAGDGVSSLLVCAGTVERGRGGGGAIQSLE